VPDAAHEALRDLVRAREAAKRDQWRARNGLTKFLLRHGKRPPEGVNPWTLNYINWVRKDVHFEPLAQQATLFDYLHEVEHMAARVTRLEQAIEEAVQIAPHQRREVIEALQALRGIAKVSAVTIVAELGELSRFGEARQLMAYRGTVSREHSSGESCKRGGITKTGNVHRSEIGLILNIRHRLWYKSQLAIRLIRTSRAGRSATCPIYRSTACSSREPFHHCSHWC